MTLFLAGLAVLSLTVLSGHVAPAVEDNNRYLKVTPLRDGFRLAYTVFLGEVPGAAERRQLDTNRDGRIDPREARAYGDQLAAKVASAIELETDGARRPLAWTTVDVGLGTDAVTAGAFSVDMIAYACVTGSPRQLRLWDRFAIARPGETEVKVEDSPGITVSRARLGAGNDARENYRFVGPGGPLADEGLDVEWTVSASAPTVPAMRCGSHQVVAPSHGRWLVVVAGVAGAALTAGLVLLWLRRRARAG